MTAEEQRIEVISSLENSMELLREFEAKHWEHAALGQKSYIDGMATMAYRLGILTKKEVDAYKHPEDGK